MALLEGQSGQEQHADGPRQERGCMQVGYCSKECQLADWKQHKPACSAKVNARSASTSAARCACPKCEAKEWADCTCEERPVCWICLESECGDLLRACACRGSAGYVHAAARRAAPVDGRAGRLRAVRDRKPGGGDAPCGRPLRVLPEARRRAVLLPRPRRCAGGRDDRRDREDPRRGRRQGCAGRLLSSGGAGMLRLPSLRTATWWFEILMICDT